MKILMLGIQSVFVLMLAFWVYATLSNIADSAANPFNWASLEGAQTIFYTGVPLLGTVMASYLKAFRSGNRGFWNESSLIAYLLAYLSFILMLLLHITAPVIQILLFMLHLFSLVFLCRVCWKRF